MRRFGPWWLAISGAVALALGSVMFKEVSASKAASSLPVLGRVPVFALVDQRDQPFSDRDLRGRVWVADFVFTHCSGQCPMMHERMRTLAQMIQHPDVRLVSFSVDPERDTPRVLAEYAAQQRWPMQRWSFVTGARAEITRVCREGFHLAMGDGESQAEPVTHSVRLALVDRRGDIRGYYDASDTAQMAQLIRDLRQLAASGE